MREKLKHLLAHWIEHNREHAEKYKEWAEKLEKDEPDVSAILKNVAEKMNEIEDLLKLALEKLQ